MRPGYSHTVGPDSTILSSSTQHESSFTSTLLIYVYYIFEVPVASCRSTSATLFHYSGAQIRPSILPLPSKCFFSYSSQVFEKQVKYILVINQKVQWMWCFSFSYFSYHKRFLYLLVPNGYTQVVS